MTEPVATASDALIPVGELTGLPIFDRSGAKLGVIKEVFASKATGHIEFVLGATGGMLGVGEKYHPIPWSTLSYHATPEGYVASFDKADLRDAPAYDRGQLSNPAYGWAEQVRRYFAMRTSS